MNGYVGLNLQKNRKPEITELKEHDLNSWTENADLVVGLVVRIAKTK